MDKLGQELLRAEVRADCRVLASAAALAEQRFGRGSDAEMEACAYQLTRCYNAIEQLGLRIAKAFENHIDDERGWHTELIRRLTLDIPGVRPAFFPANVVADLQDLRAFRHVVVHAYDLTLQKSRLAPVLEAAGRLALQIPDISDHFFNRLP